MISFSFKVFLILNVGVSFHVDGAIRHRRNQRKRRDDRFSLYGGHGDVYGSGSGFGPDKDEIPRGEELWL